MADDLLDVAAFVAQSRTYPVLDGREVLMHCWRGGMRSESVGWLLSFVDYRVRRLRGGYKAFRRYVRALPSPAPSASWAG